MLIYRILALVLLALTPALVIQGYNELALRGAREQSVRAEVRRGAQAAAADLEQFGQRVRDVLSILALDPAVRHLEPLPCTDFLRSVIERLPGSGMIGVIDEPGQLVCNTTGQTPSSYDFNDRVYFQQVKRTGAFAVGDYVQGRISGRPTIQLAQPISDKEGRLTGVLFDSIDLSWLAQRLSSLALPPDATLTVADRNGRILVRLPDGQDWIGRQLAQGRAGQLYGGTAEPHDDVDLDGKPSIVSTAKLAGIFSGVSVEMARDRAAAFADVDAATKRGLVLLLLGACLAIAAALISNRTFISQPVQRLLSAAVAWQRGDLSVRTGLTGKSEFGQLGQAFDAMASAIYSHEISLNAEITRSHALQEQQAIMLHELNHRVKNTLATVQSLVRQARGGEEQAAELEGRILALSKTHDLLTQADWTSAPLREVANNELAPYRRRTGCIAIDGPEIELPARHVLALGMTLHELTTNAAKYGALSSEQGCISLSWSLSHPEACTLNLSLTWREHDGPAVVQPSRRGFGTRLIISSIERELAGRVKLVFDSAGLVCRIEVPLEQQKPVTGCFPQAIASPNS